MTKKKATNKVKLDFDTTAAVSVTKLNGFIAADTLAPADNYYICPFCKAAHSQSGITCHVCQLSTVGEETVGINLVPLE